MIGWAIRRENGEVIKVADGEAKPISVRESCGGPCWLD